MAANASRQVTEELRKALTRPWRLPRTIMFSAIGTIGWLLIAVSLHLFHRGVPYAAAELFIWSLASYNASQLGNDSDTVLEHTRRKKSLRELFIVKNATLLILSVPIDLVLITLACWYIGDWSKFWLSIPLAIAAVIISLGLGNIVSVGWVYRPSSLWKARHDRVKLYEYAIFITLSYLAASAALYLTLIPADLLLKITNLDSVIFVSISIILLFAWAAVWWLFSLRASERLAERYHSHFISRLSGETPKIKNPKLKRVLKVT